MYSIVSCSRHTVLQSDKVGGMKQLDGNSSRLRNYDFKTRISSIGSKL